MQPVNTPMPDIDLQTHSLTGWPQRGECPHCGGELCLLVATYGGASYECRGSLPHPPKSAYSADRCAGKNSIQRYERLEEPECEHVHTRPDPDSDEWLCDDCGQRIFSP